MSVSYEAFIAKIAHRTGLAEVEAQAASRATLEALGEHLSRQELETISSELPAPLGRMLRGSARASNLGAEALYRAAAAHEAVGPGFVREHVQVVCEVVAESIGQDTLTLLHKHLSHDLADLFTPRERFPAAVPPAIHHAPEQPHTLATGRPPSSRKPVSEADVAHDDSIARSDNPYEDDKLSSTTGVDHLRKRQTLATGRPGSERPLSEK